jgi:diadenosine tetraphosphate (Ap4A) HIT family hydrolase
MSNIDDPWARQRAGIECYLCSPRLSTKRDIRNIASLSIASLYLIQDQRFLGQSTLIFHTRHATRFEELSDGEYIAFAQDLRLSVRAICGALNSDHVNVAMLGNSCPHLHWGIVPRYRTDPCWGKPIWEGTTVQQTRFNPTTLAEAEYVAVVSKIRNELQRLVK